MPIGLAALLPAVIGGAASMAGAGISALSQSDPAEEAKKKIEMNRTPDGFNDFGAGLESDPSSARAQRVTLRNSRKPVLFNPSQY